MGQRNDTHALLQDSLLRRVDGQLAAAAGHEADDDGAVKAAPDLQRIVDNPFNEQRMTGSAARCAARASMYRHPGMTPKHCCMACKTRHSLMEAAAQQTGAACRGRDWRRLPPLGMTGPGAAQSRARSTPRRCASAARCCSTRSPRPAANRQSPSPKPSHAISPPRARRVIAKTQQMAPCAPLECMQRVRVFYELAAWSNACTDHENAAQ